MDDTDYLPCPRCGTEVSLLVEDGERGACPECAGMLHNLTTDQAAEYLGVVWRGRAWRPGTYKR